MVAGLWSAWGSSAEPPTALPMGLNALGSGTFLVGDAMSLKRCRSASTASRTLVATEILKAARTSRSAVLWLFAGVVILFALGAPGRAAADEWQGPEVTHE